MLIVIIVLYKVIEITDKLFKMKSNLIQTLKTVSNQDTSLKYIMIKNIESIINLTLKEIYKEKKVVIESGESGHNCRVFLSGFD